MGFLGREGRDDAPGVVVLGARLANSEGFLRRLDTYVIKCIWVGVYVINVLCAVYFVPCTVYFLHCVPYTLVGEKKVFYYVLLL